MRPLYVCTMVFNRHDLLEKLFRSIATSTRRPDAVYVVDHAYDPKRIEDLHQHLGGIELRVITIDNPGNAVAANWLLTNIPDDKVGCGDDVQFYPDTLEIMSNTEGDFVLPDNENNVNPGACCIIRKGCVDKVGLFDEKISPNFLYFEDSDYIRRIGLAGIPHTFAKGARVIHDSGGSQTMKKYTQAQMDEHHARFRIARANYVKKWGGEPFHETLTTPREL